jgi:hypothetical protein
MLIQVRQTDVVKIDKKTLTMVVDEELEGSLEEIGEGESFSVRNASCFRLWTKKREAYRVGKEQDMVRLCCMRAERSQCQRLA